MAYRYPESLSCLAREGPAACINNRSRYHHRNMHPGTLEKLLDGKKCSFAVEGIKHCFNKQKINASLHQSFELQCVVIHHFPEADSSEARVVDIGGE